MTKSYVFLIVILVAIVGILSWTIAPAEKAIYKAPAKPDVSDCEKSLAIKVGQDGYIKKGYWQNNKAKVLGKIDNGVDCAYSVEIKSHNSGTVYVPVNADNLFPINGETVR